jgi:menaquinone-9 beta-reductase
MNNLMVKTHFDIAIIGGGLAGLISAIELTRNGYSVVLFEKKVYPFHKVCGEYLSNEVKPYLAYLGIDAVKLGLPDVNNLIITGMAGKTKLKTALPLGGFGISRYKLDNLLHDILLKEKATVHTGTKVKAVGFNGNNFTITTDKGVFSSNLCIGSYGKRDALDKNFNRQFILNRSPYMAVKYHVKTSFEPDYIGLFNFKNGYCGLSPIEDGKYSLCYLSHRGNMKGLKSVKELEYNVLFKNKALYQVFRDSEFLFDAPKVINEISFAPKPLIENHVFMCGDSAGMISPICGNGMAMAIHGAKLLSKIITGNIRPGNQVSTFIRGSVERIYAREWNQHFRRRLEWGRWFQKFAGNSLITGPFLDMANSIPGLKKWVVRQTHGTEITAE